jgi:hypothetical protein
VDAATVSHIQNVEHAEGHGDRLFEAVGKLGLEGIVSKSSMRHFAQVHQKPGSKSKTRKRQRLLAPPMERFKKISRMPFCTITRIALSMLRDYRKSPSSRVPIIGSNSRSSQSLG